MAETTAQDVLREVKEQHVKFIHLQFTDILGIVKGVTIPSHELDAAFDRGVWFDGSSVQGFARIAESDMYLAPDPTTFKIIPWEAKEGIATARMICDVYTPAGTPFPGDPRRVLKDAVAKAESLGFTYNIGPELEFFLFRRDADGNPTLIPHDQGGYFDYSTDLAITVRKDMVAALEVLGIMAEASHHEVAIGQHEIDFKYADAVKTADNAITFKYVLKAVARFHNLYASFMPKPIAGINGSGMHTHQSLVAKDTGKNAFANPDDTFGLSVFARQFIAGQLAHARALSAIVAPLVNSYKRLVPGYEAPVYISWARINRSALIRVPKVSDAEATRLELRCPDPSCNPYLAFAAILMAGLDGIQKGMTPPDALEENLYDMGDAYRDARKVKVLPGSLREALDCLAEDKVIQDALGPHVYERFVKAKRQEWDEYRMQVTEWETRRYLTMC
ncbi:MAG: type I glutamate--ammonia ligase [Anaerolineae bacterium]|nr:type I glutamate--ammonia ligase [Anaerolineae bacterium]